MLRMHSALVEACLTLQLLQVWLTMCLIQSFRLPMPVLQDKFFTQLRASPHGFNVIADFFSRGILNVTNQQSESN